MRRFLPFALLDILVLKDLLPYFLIGMALFTSIFFAADPIVVASRYLSEGVPLFLVLQIIGVYLPPEVALTLPMGMLLGTLQGFGRLSGDSESVALFAGGIPFARIAAPAAAIGFVVSLLGFYVNDHLATAAYLEKTNLESKIKTTYLNNPTPGFAGQPLDLPVRNPDGTLLAQVHVEHGLDLATRTMRDVSVILYNHGVPTEFIHAQRGQYPQSGLSDYTHWILYGVDINQLNAQASYLHLPTMTVQPLTQSPQEIALLDRDDTTLNFFQTRRKASILRSSGKNMADVRQTETDAWSKIAVPLSALVFTLIGAPLGLRPQRSSRTTGWFLAILIIFGYYVLYTAMASAARGGGLSPMLAAFLPDVIGLVVGSCLIWRASR